MDDPDHENPLAAGFERTYFAPIFQQGIKAGEFKPGDAARYADIYWHFVMGSILEQVRNPERKIQPSVDLLISLFEP